eukprot:4340873-Pleurochrysis_carterae.AAC.3
MSAYGACQASGVCNHIHGSARAQSRGSISWQRCAQEVGQDKRGDGKLNDQDVGSISQGCPGAV